MRFLAPVVWRLACAAAIGLGMASTASAASGRLTLESGGIRRSAFIVEHARLKRARRPVIIFLHGQSGAGVRVRDRLGLDRKIKSRSVVVAYPDALGGRWDVSEAGAEREQDGQDDHGVVGGNLHGGIMGDGPGVSTGNRPLPAG